MVDKTQLRTLVEETMRAFVPFYQEAMRKATQDSDAPNSWFGLSLAHGSDPAPFTVERYHAMSPYNAQKRLVEILEELAQLELLERVGESAYILTDLGRSAVEGIFEAAHRGLDTIEPLPADEMDQLNALLYRMVEATLEAPEPEGKWAITYSRWTDPGEDASGSAKADQYMTDLLRYRDDAHIAAWKPYDVSGHAWEALTFIWRGDASTAEEMVERLPARSYTVEDYREALQDLTTRGWVIEEAGAYKLTEEGKQIREEAEEATDRHFYVGWSALNDDELAQLEDLLTRAKESLQTATLGQLWSLVRDLSRAIPASVRDTTGPLVEQHGLNQPGHFFALLSAHRFEPDPISAALIGVRGPYAHPTVYDNLLAEVAEAGFLSPREGGEYERTEKGRTALQEINHTFYTQLGEISLSLSKEEMAQLENLLNRVVEASLNTEESDGKWCISKTHQGHPSQEYAPLAKIDQHMDDLNAFREGIHIDAWKPYDVSAHAWETLTLVWRDEAHTAEELAERPFRGHSVETYTEALADLANRGWVEQTTDGYQVTEKGQALRQKAEEATDRYFFAPWACLSQAEKIQLHDLMTRLRNDLQEMVENNEGEEAE